MAKHLPANNPNQPAMPLHDLCERFVVPVPDEPHDELAIRGNDSAPCLTVGDASTFRKFGAMAKIRVPKGLRSPSGIVCIRRQSGRN